MAVLCLDFGGSNIRYVVMGEHTGGFLTPIERIKSSSLKSDNDIAAFINKLAAGELTKRIKHKIHSEDTDIKSIAITSAGDIDEHSKIIKHSPNTHLKRMKFPKMLENKGYEVVLVNDMNAGTLGLALGGEGKGYRNVVGFTFSTGTNAAKCVDGRITTNCEAGHNVYDPNSQLFCGCSNRGCYEIHVGPNGAADIAKQYLMRTKDYNHTLFKISRNLLNMKNGHHIGAEESIDGVINNVDGKAVYMAYRKNPKQEPQRYIRDMQVNAIASYLAHVNTMLRPIDIMVLKGPHTKEDEVLFNPAIELFSSGEFEMPSLKKPKVVISDMEEPEVIGAFFYFLSKKMPENYEKFLKKAAKSN